MKNTSIIAVILFLFSNVLCASEIKDVNFSEICAEKWLDTSLSDDKKYLLLKPSNLNELCPLIMSGKANKEQFESFLKQTYNGNIPSWFMLGYFIFEHDTSENKDTDFAIEVIKQSAFWRNPYAHAYLYKVYSTDKYGYENNIQALLSLEHYKSSLNHNTMMQTNLTSDCGVNPNK